MYSTTHKALLLLVLALHCTVGYIVLQLIDSHLTISYIPIPVLSTVLHYKTSIIKRLTKLYINTKFLYQWL